MGLCRRRFCPSLLVLMAICLTHTSTDGFAPGSHRRVTLLVSQRLDAAAAGAPSDEPGASSSKRTPFMESVRSIQDVFYSSGRGDENRPFLNKTTGTMGNLPILISPSTELPGRQTVRFIDNPLDINMLELSLRGYAEKGDKGNHSHCFIGQLYRDPNETGDGPLSRPKSWKDFSPDAYDDSESGTCVGTLLRIMDFRRVNDGRMVLLVQGIERFVINKVHQELPYIIVDAQIILDEEELMAYPMPSAVAASFAWHSFEYEDNVKLTEDGSPGEEVCIGAIVGERLAQLIPFISFKSTNARDISLLQKSIARANSEVLDLVSVGSNDAPIQHLTCRNVLNEVPTFDSHGGRLSARDIEYDLWICIDEYVRLRGLHDVMSSDLMALLPQGKDWPNEFCLEDVAAKLEAKNTQGDGVGRPSYPNERRLKRLSYSASALLGGSTPSDLLNKGVRQMLLEVPSTRGRLWAVLERFVEYNSLLRSKHVDK